MVGRSTGSAVRTTPSARVSFSLAMAGRRRRADDLFAACHRVPVPLPAGSAVARSINRRSAGAQHCGIRDLAGWLPCCLYARRSEAGNGNCAFDPSILYNTGLSLALMAHRIHSGRLMRDISASSLNER